MAPFPSFMRERNKIWHYRRRVPSDLRQLFNDLHEFTKTCRSTQKGAARVMRAQYDRELDLIFLALRAKLMTPEMARSRVDELFDTRKFSESVAPPAYQSAGDLVGGVKLSAVIELCEQTNALNWTPKTLAEKRAIYKIIADRFGQKTITAIKVGDVLEWRNVLLKTLGLVTVNKYLTNLSGVFKFAIQHEYATHNPTIGLQLKDARVEADIRKAYSETDLILLFRELLSIKKDCYDKGRHERFWAPLICMYTGMRADECAQLDVDDIDLNECSIAVTPAGPLKDKKIKNKSSIRDLPIHPDLLTLGLGVYVKNTAKLGHIKLFPSLKKHSLNGYAHELVKWWGRWARNLIPDSAKTLHSFRHTVADKLKQSGVDGFLISEIMGHTVENISVGRYGKHYLLEVKGTAMECLSTGMVPKITDYTMEPFIKAGTPMVMVSYSIGGLDGRKYKMPFPADYFSGDSPYIDYSEAYQRPDWYGWQYLHRYNLRDLWREEIHFELKQDILAGMNIVPPTA